MVRPHRSTGWHSAAIAGMAMSLLLGPAPASAQQGKDLSENSVRTMMSYAWAITPPKFTAGGKEIVVDKNKREQAMVPLDAAREIIRVGRLSANAQMCGLPEEQAANYQTMMKREQAKNTWSDQQLVYINTLHLFTVMLMTGGVKIVETEEGKDGKDGGKQVVIENAKLERPKADACNDAERAKVKQQIDAYVLAGAAPKKN
jgi:hypothetical protein